MTAVLRGRDTELLLISHSGDRAGAPMVLLRFLEWLERNTDVESEVLLLHGGAMEAQFARFGARVVGGGGSRLWMLQHGLSKLGYRRTAVGLAAARLAPPIWANRGARLVVMNSVGSLPALQWMPERGQQVVLYVHELDQGFNRTIGRRVWDRLSPRVDRFIACSAEVEAMLVERAGVRPEQVSCQHGFIDPPVVDVAHRDALRAQLGIGEGALVVGACGRPDWRKAPEVLIRVADVLGRRRPDLDVHFVWIGGPMHGSPGDKLLHDIHAAGLGDRFHLVDETPHPHDYMGMFDVFCLTSREDPFPLSMLEAGALGVPVVAFANGGVVGLAAAGGDRPLASVVPYLDIEAMADTVAGLLDDPDRRAADGARLAAHVRANHLTEIGAPALFDALVERLPALRARVRTAAPSDTSAA